jgi:hypothetical protein
VIIGTGTRVGSGVEIYTNGVNAGVSVGDTVVEIIVSEVSGGSLDKTTF